MAEAKKHNDPETYMTVRQASGFLKISRVTTWRLIRHGKLKKFKVGNRTLLRSADVEALVREA